MAEGYRVVTPSGISLNHIKRIEFRRKKNTYLTTFITFQTVYSMPECWYMITLSTLQAGRLFKKNQTHKVLLRVKGPATKEAWVSENDKWLNTGSVRVRTMYRSFAAIWDGKKEEKGGGTRLFHNHTSLITTGWCKMLQGKMKGVFID